MAFLRGGPEENKSIRELLDSLALEDSKDDKVIKGVTQPRIRTLAKMAQQIADEHGIAQPAGRRTPDEMFEGAPLKDLARILKSFTYGTMMQLDRELQDMPVDATKQGSMAALLHAWAMKALGLNIPPAQPNQPTQELSHIAYTSVLPPAEVSTGGAVGPEAPVGAPAPD